MPIFNVHFKHTNGSVNKSTVPWYNKRSAHGFGQMVIDEIASDPAYDPTIDLVTYEVVQIN